MSRFLVQSACAAGFLLMGNLLPVHAQQFYTPPPYPFYTPPPYRFYTPPPYPFYGGDYYAPRPIYLPTVPLPPYRALAEIIPPPPPAPPVLIVR